MLIKITDIKPSPYNPKQPLTKKQYEALKRNVEKYGFQRDLLVCKDFNNGGEGYICLDGHTAIELLRDLGREEVDCKVVDNVKDRRTLTEFITGYAISKKPLINEMYKELGSDFEELFGKSVTFIEGYKQPDFDEIKNQKMEVEQTSYFLTLPSDCVKKLKNLCKTKAYKTDRYKAIADKIDSVEEEKFLEKLFESLFLE
jgi:hypothetical protein